MSNVLVYSGPGVSASSLSHTLRTLRRLLPSYDVQCINAQSLAIDPWMETTSLLILPGGRDLPYVEKLSEHHRSSNGASSGPRNGSSSRMARADARISEYVVERGGAFLGICAGAYYASGRCEFERGDAIMEVIGERPALRFFPGTCSGTVYPGFVYESDTGARLVSLSLAEEPAGAVWSTYYNGGGAFLDARSFADDGVEVLASYMTDQQAQQRGAAAGSYTHSIRSAYAGQAAAILCRSGQGRALLYGTHPEFPVAATASPAQKTAAPEAMQGVEASFDELERRRFELFGKHLQRLGLRVDLPSSSGEELGMKLTPLVLASQESRKLESVVRDLRLIATEDKHIARLDNEPTAGKLFSLSDSNDTVHVYDGASPAQLFDVCARADYSSYLAPVSTPNNVDASRAGQSAEPEMEVDLQRVPKYVLIAGDGASSQAHTPHWNMPVFFEATDASRALLAAKTGKERWADPSGSASMFATDEVQTERIADIVTYAQVVTSTQTMLDKNYKLLTRLPSGFTSFATHQVSGRGRGKNAWISPLGCLQFSVLLRLPRPQQTLWHAGMSSIVFVQYLAGLAIVESVRSGALGEEYATAIGSKIRIKWPNDVYAEVEDAAHSGIPQTDGTRKGTFVWRGKRYAKMAGVLVNSQFAGSELALVVGCGINTLNARPTTSLSDLIEGHNASNASSPSLAIVSQERFAGAILATFERMWTTSLLVGGNFAPFVDAYRRAWLHSDQDTLLTDTEPPTRARIVGITSDHGLLRCVPLPPAGISKATPGLPDTYSHGAWGTSADSAKSAVPFIDLQPDGNSFDMLQNLIRRKK